MALDPDAQRVVDLIVEADRPAFEDVGYAEARQLYLNARTVLQNDPVHVAEVRDLSVPAPFGDIALRLYRHAQADEAELQPCLIYLHGGGWVVGDLDSHDGVCRELANRTRCTVISVDYRLAPEHAFPAAVEDSWSATRWIAENAGSLRIDPTRLAIGGDSAGGNLATVVCMLARDSGGPALSAQVLIYPATDMTMSHASHVEFADQLPLTRASMHWFIDTYLSSEADKADWRASPLQAENFADLPAACIITAGCDPLRDEGEAYAAALRAAGVSVSHTRFAGQIHGFLTMGRMIAQTDDALTLVSEALRVAFTGHAPTSS